MCSAVPQMICSQLAATVQIPCRILVCGAPFPHSVGGTLFADNVMRKRRSSQRQYRMVVLQNMVNNEQILTGRHNCTYLRQMVEKRGVVGALPHVWQASAAEQACSWNRPPEAATAAQFL